MAAAAPVDGKKLPPARPTPPVRPPPAAADSEGEDSGPDSEPEGILGLGENVTAFAR